MVKTWMKVNGTTQWAKQFKIRPVDKKHFVPSYDKKDSIRSCFWLQTRVISVKKNFTSMLVINVNASNNVKIFIQNFAPLHVNRPSFT